MQHVTVPLKELFTRRKQNKPPNGTELHLQVHKGPWQMANVTSRVKGMLTIFFCACQPPATLITFFARDLFGTINFLLRGAMYVCVTE